jgi:ketosteroid isomerase-like protein
MSIQENVQFMEDTLAASGRGGMQGLLALSAVGIEWIIPGEWPVAGTYRAEVLT